MAVRGTLKEIAEKRSSKEANDRLDRVLVGAFRQPFRTMINYTGGNGIVRVKRALQPPRIANQGITREKGARLC